MNIITNLQPKLVIINFLDKNTIFIIIEKN